MDSRLRSQGGRITTFVIGSPFSKAEVAEAESAIAGYTVANDVSMRDWQWRATQWLQGKSFDRSTPLGPYLTTRDEVAADKLNITCQVDGTTVYEAHTSDLVFTPPEIASYISQFATSLPGDVVLTGTPDGVGAGRRPQTFLREGQVLTTMIDGLGSCVNSIGTAS